METPSSLQERELLEKVASGDEQAFSILFHKYSDEFYAFFYKTTRSPVVAEELLSDLFFNLWINREMVNDIRHLPSFLQTIAGRRAADFFRKSARSSKLQELIEYEMRLDRLDERSADHRLLDEETRQVLRNAIQQLSPQRRLIFMLSKEQGLSHEQIASYLNVSQGTVRNTLMRALKSIRLYLKEQQVDPIIGGIVMAALHQP
mgnify:CR=1 FL=1